MEVSPNLLEVKTVAELTEKVYSGESYIAQSDANGSLTKVKFKDLGISIPIQNALNELQAGVQVVSPSDSPLPNISKYLADGVGTYTNFGGIEVSAQDILDGDVEIRRSTTGTFSKKIVPVPGLVNYVSKVDAQYKGTFATIALAIAEVPLAVRGLGDTVGIVENGAVVEYSWKKGIADENLESHIVNNFTVLKNILDVTLLDEDKAISTNDGSIVDNSEWALFKPVTTLGNKTYTFDSGIDLVNLRVRFEDASGALISFINAASKPFTFTTPGTAKRLVLPAYWNDPTQAHSAQLLPHEGLLPESKVDLPSYRTFNETVEELEAVFVRADVRSINKIDSRFINVGQAVVPDGSIVEGLPGWASFAPTKVGGNTEYTFQTALAPNDIRIRFEDATHSLISVLTTPTSVITFITPANCEYLVLPAYYNDESQALSAQLELGNIASAVVSGIPKISKSILPVSNSHWEGKELFFFGDSITWNDKYTKITASLLGATYNHNGVSGSCIATGKEEAQGDGVYRTSLVARVPLLAQYNPDAIFIFAGTNDWYYQVPIGTIDDAGSDTFYGGVKTLIRLLQAQHPVARIMLSTMTPRNQDRAYFTEQRAYCDAAIKASALYGVPCYDLHAKSGLSHENIMTYTTDGTHFNTTGDELVSRQFAAFINQC